MNVLHLSSLRADEDEGDVSSGTLSRAPNTSKNIHDIVSHPHNVSLPHEQLHGVLGRTQ
jgi:hypothetical protein